ncbi:MAG TPA: energy transducer TonB [Candidatus Angelobacter sp.]|nr:energy transducer TonB [Candidatus Angelobacter sp.]
MKTLKSLAAVMFIVNAIWSFGIQALPVPPKIRVSGAVMEAFVIHKVDAEYPTGAVRSASNVTVVITIDRQGNVTKAALIKGAFELAEAAENAVKQWKYRPYVLGGNPVEVETTAVVFFRSRGI